MALHLQTPAEAVAWKAALLPAAIDAFLHQGPEMADFLQIVDP